jgi:Flp pilus assembly secretin CpaC
MSRLSKSVIYLLYTGAEMIAMAEVNTPFEQPRRFSRVRWVGRATYIAIFIVTTLGAHGANGNEPNHSSPATESAKTTIDSSKTVDWTPNPSYPGMQNGKLLHKPMSTFGLEEYKTSTIIDLQASQSRLFKIKNRVTRTSISDSKIAEPVVVSENDIVMLAKAPGTATLGLWDDANNISVIQLRVKKENGSPEASLKALFEAPQTPIRAVEVGTISLEECKVTKVVDLKVSESRLFKTPHRIVRTSASNPAIADLAVPAENGVYLVGKAPGTASAFLWDDVGNMVGIELRVSEENKNSGSTPCEENVAALKTTKASHLAPFPASPSTLEVELWTGHKKDIQSPELRFPGPSN